MSTASHGYAGPYRLLNIINTGQTSQVWQAYHDGSRKYVAVKMLQREYARDKEHVRFLKWEYTVAGKIEHERICRVYQFGREPRYSIPRLGVVSPRISRYEFVRARRAPSDRGKGGASGAG